MKDQFESIGVNASPLRAPRVLFVTIGLIQATFAQIQPVFLNLPTPPNPSSAAVAVNQAGQVTGWFESETTFEQAFIWQNGTTTLLGNYSPLAINNNAQVLLFGNEVWSNGAITALAKPQLVLPANVAVADLNDSLEVAGCAQRYVHFGYIQIPLENEAFLWPAAGMPQTIANDIPSSEGACPVALNNSRQVLLFGFLRPSSTTLVSQAYLWQNGKRSENLGTLGGAATFPADINALGQVTGTSMLADGTEHAFLWQNGVMQDLGVPAGGVESYGYSIDSAGRVLLRSVDANQISTFWVWKHGTFFQLDGLGGFVQNPEQNLNQASLAAVGDGAMVAAVCSGASGPAACVWYVP